MLREGRAGLLFLSVCALSLLNATAPLNPTVKVVKHPKASLPPECDEGVAPPPSPRIQIADVTPPPPAAHRTSAGDLLQETQAAAARGDREGFNDALARLKANGGNNDVIRIYDDLNRLWTYEFESPTGAFFDSSNELLSMLSAYPGYRKAIEEQTLTVGGTKLYPSRESRDFLVREAASRGAKQLGLTKKPAPKEKPRTTTTVAEVQPKPKPKPKKTVHHVQHVAEKKPKPTPPPARVPAPVPVPVPVPVPAPAPATTTIQPPVATTTTAPPPPVTTTTAAPVPAPATDTTPTAVTTATQPLSNPTTPETTTTAATETTAPQQQKSPMKNVILPIILIVIGVGVLIVLFRASS